MPLPVGMSKQVAASAYVCSITGEVILPGDTYYKWSGQIVSRNGVLRIIALAKLTVADL